MNFAYGFNSLIQSSNQILLVEDIGDDTGRILSQLDKLDFKVQVNRVISKREFKGSIQNDFGDLIICRYNTSEFSGLETLEFVRELHSCFP